MQRLAEFGIYHDLQMTPQEAHHVNLCPQWNIVLNAMIESRRNELQCKAIKKNRWNNREADRQAEKAHGRVLWLDAMTHEGERISIININ